MESKGRLEELQAKRELFLQAFEKPTQIYRFLRMRHIVSPIFLHRNLSFMRCRRSKRSASSSAFKVDSLLENKLSRMRNKGGNNGGQNLVISLSGFCDKKRERGSDRVSVDAMLVREIHERRKCASSPSSVSVVKSFSKTDVVVNPSSDESSSNMLIWFDKELFQHEDPRQCSYALVFCVKRTNGSHTSVQSQGSVLSSSSAHSLESSSEPKRRKLLRGSSSYMDENKILMGDLSVFDRKEKCQLTKGEYELALNENECGETTSISANDLVSNWVKRSVAHWENFTPNVEPLEAFEASPVLKFKVWWSQKKQSTAENSFPRFLSEKEKISRLNTSNGTNIVSTSGNRGRPSASRSSKGGRNSLSNLDAMNSSTSNNGRGSPKIVYQFLFNNDCRQQTEATSGFYCPWCSLNCMNLYSLLKHLKLSHPRFLFTYVPIAEGARIDVCVSELFDTTYVGNPHDLISQPNAFSRLGPVQRTPITHVLVCKPKRTPPSLSEFLDVDAFDNGDGVYHGAYEAHRPFVSGHNRLYHYSTTNLPMPPHAILHAACEDEVAPSWLTTKICAMIDEFSDVNDGEKHFMKMWNLHMQRNNFVGDCQISMALSSFLESHGSRLLELGLYRNFVIHCCNLFEFGVISPLGVFNAFSKMQRIFKEQNLQPLKDFGDIKKEWKKRQEEASRDQKSDTEYKRKDFSGIFGKNATDKSVKTDEEEDIQMQDHNVSSSTQDEQDLQSKATLPNIKTVEDDEEDSDNSRKKTEKASRADVKGKAKDKTSQKTVTMIKITPSST